MATTTLHASAFAHKGTGCLLLGDSGSGKSRLLAQAVLLGAELIADDQVVLSVDEDQLLANAPTKLLGVMELRGLGLVKLPHVGSPHPIHLAIALDSGAAGERLPEPQTHDFLGIKVPYLYLL